MNIKQFSLLRTSFKFGIMAEMPDLRRGGWVVRRCWVNFQFRGVLLIWIIVGQ